MGRSYTVLIQILQRFNTILYAITHLTDKGDHPSWTGGGRAEGADGVVVLDRGILPVEFERPPRLRH